MTSTAPNRIFSIATLAIILTVLYSCTSTTAAPANKGINAPRNEPDPFASIDKQVRNLSVGKQRSIPELINTLNEIAETDWEKTRALYIWVTQNIAYDTDSFFRGVSGPTDPRGTFQTRHSVCEGYAGLFAEIGTRLGLEVVKVHGYAKGWGYREGQDPGGTNHAWNAVRVNGSWHLFDSTWGAGYVDGKDFHRRYKEFYFDTPPEKFIFSHYPENPDYQFTANSVSRELFFKLPDLDGKEFNSGVDAAEVRNLIESGGKFGMPTIYNTDFPVKLIEFPMVSTLQAGHSYRIVIESASPYALISYGNNQSEIITNHRGRFIINGKYPRGSLGIFLAPLHAKDEYSDSYDGFLMYPVE